MEASRAAPSRGRRGSLRRLAPIGRKRSRQPEAFELLYREHAPEVYRYALALLANPADAEDVTQTTFLNAYRAFQRGERPRTPHNWLIAIAHNVCRMRWRQANARPREIALDEAPEPAMPEPEHERANLDEVLQALAQLSFNQRAALVMRELEGRSYKEIAEVLDLSVGAVEALIFRARRGLRLQRRALGLLTTAPVPGSLASSFGAGGGAVAAGGAALGADLAVKAAAVVAAGAVTAGVGYQTVGAVVGTSGSEAGGSQVQAIEPATPAAVASTRQARGAGKATANHRTHLRRATAGKRTGKASALDPAPASQPAAAANPTGAAAAPPPPPSPTQTATGTVAGTLPVPLPPPPTVQPPPAPTVTLPPLPVTVTTPTVPPPPKLP